MGHIRFRKDGKKVIYISDTPEKYEILNKYFTWNESEIPYDSSQFKRVLGNGLSVIEISPDFKVNSKIDFSRYLVEDADVKKQEIEGKKSEEEYVIKQQQIEERKAEEVKQEQVKKEQEEERIKQEADKPIILDDEFIKEQFEKVIVEKEEQKVVEVVKEPKRRGRKPKDGKNKTDL